MRRRHHHPEPGADRWLISYSDFVTLLFALFVVLYAAAQSNHGDSKAVARVVRQSMTGPDTAAPEQPVDPQPPPATPVHNLEEAQRALSRVLAREIADEQVEVILDKRGLSISLREKGFFPSGGDQLESAARQSLAKLAAVIRQLPNPIRLEGHTDSLPIHTARFQSNWELSAARAIAVLTLLQESTGLDPQRFEIAAYADHQPLGDNASADGRALNRRVEVVLAAVEH